MPKDLISVVRSTKYTLDAFLFVQRGLEFTVNRVHGEADPDAEPAARHVTGEDLCLGLRDYAIEQYGLLARTVLRRWGITRCEDFGNIVFAMVDAGLMQKTDDDTIEDFRDVFDFKQAFSPTLQVGGAN